MSVKITDQFVVGQIMATSHRWGFADASRFATLGGEHPAFADIVGPVRREVMIETKPGRAEPL